MGTLIFIIAVSTLSPLTLAGVLALSQWDKRVARRVQARSAAMQPASEPPQEWRVSLLVDANEDCGILRPIIQLVGPPLPSLVTVDLSVGKRSALPYLSTRRRFMDPTTSSDLVLGTLRVPEGLSVAKVAREHWTVTVSQESQEIAHHRGPLIPTPSLNAEAELCAPDLEPESRGGYRLVRLPRTHEAPVRHLGNTIRLTVFACFLIVAGALTVMQLNWLCLPGAVVIGLGGVFALGASRSLYVDCPLCGQETVVMGRTAAQRCEACNGRFLLVPGKP
ncbi:MAG: hypothetical protein JXA87_07000 [Thermoleophilia bacterium]|nr:hypothetical protein [Thermoleophilia bacterium]